MYYFIYVIPVLGSSRTRLTKLITSEHNDFYTYLFVGSKVNFIMMSFSVDIQLGKNRNLCKKEFDGISHSESEYVFIR